MTQLLEPATGVGEQPAERSGRGAWLTPARVGQVGLYVVSLGVALGLSALLVAVTGHSPSTVFADLYDGSVRGWGSIGYTIDQSTPLLIVALGAIISTRAGQFNIGQEGQLTIGAIAGGFVALKVSGPGPLIIVLTLVASAAGGALWSGISALLKYWRGVDVVISSLLLVFVAEELIQYVVNVQWLLAEPPINGGTAATQSSLLDSKYFLPHFGTYPHPNMGSGFVGAIVLAVLVFILLGRSRWGFRLKVLGLNPVVARRIGIRAGALGGLAVVLCGAFAGLAGGVMLTGQAHRLTPGFSNNVGWDGLLVALVAQNNALVAVVVALFYGGLETGGGLLATANVPSDLVNVVQALLVLGAVFPPAYRQLRQSRRRHGETRLRRSVSPGGAR